MTSIDGLGVSAGRVVGPLVHMPGSIAEPPSEASLADGTSPEPEAQRIEEAAEAVAAALRETAEQASGDAQSVLEATAMMAADPTLVEAAQTKVREGGASAPRAVWDAAEEVSAQLADLGGYMAERARSAMYPPRSATCVTSATG
jgi:phosphotransferase system enzyme I (PtsI)